MSQTFVVQGCPVCGRRLQIRTQFIGRRVQCTHCGGSFRSRLDADEYSSSPDHAVREAAGAERPADELPVLPR